MRFAETRLEFRAAFGSFIHSENGTTRQERPEWLDCVYIPTVQDLGRHMELDTRRLTNQRRRRVSGTTNETFGLAAAAIPAGWTRDVLREGENPEASFASFEDLSPDRHLPPKVSQLPVD